MGKLSSEELMTIKVLCEKEVSHREVGRKLGVDESTVRYHRRRQLEKAVDGRSAQAHKAAAVRPAIDAWLKSRELTVPDSATEL